MCDTNWNLCRADGEALYVYYEYQLCKSDIVRRIGMANTSVTNSNRNSFDNLSTQKYNRDVRNSFLPRKHTLKPATSNRIRSLLASHFVLHLQVFSEKVITFRTFSEGCQSWYATCTSRMIRHPMMLAMCNKNWNLCGADDEALYTYYEYQLRESYIVRRIGMSNRTLTNPNQNSFDNLSVKK